MAKKVKARLYVLAVNSTRSEWEWRLWLPYSRYVASPNCYVTRKAAIRSAAKAVKMLNLDVVEGK